MNKSKIAISVFLIALTSVSCVQIDDYGDTDSNVIRLNASTRTATKGSASGTSGVVNQTTDVELPLGLVRIDQNHNVGYPGFTETSEPVTGTLGRPDGSSLALREVEFDHAEFYRNATSLVSFASFSPWHPELPGYSYETNALGSKVYIPIDGQTDILYGSITTGAKDRPFNTIQYNHALSQYNIYVYAMIGKKEKLDDDGNVVLDANGDIIYEEYDTSDIWGELTDLKVRDVPDGCILTLPKDGEGKYEISYTDQDFDVRFNDSNDLFFLKNTKLPAGYENKVKVATCVAGPPTDGQLHLEITTSGTTGAITKDVSIARNFRPGYAYDVFLRFSDHGFVNSSVQVTSWQNGNTYVVSNEASQMYHDLSRYGSANSYLVQAGNYGYAFDGKVKGNGSGSNARMNPGYVDIIWSDFDNTRFNGQDGNPVKLKDGSGGNEPFVKLASNHLTEDGRVLFYVGREDTNLTHALRKEGNVVIGAYTDESKTQLLWTWHIWLTEKVRELGIGNGYTMLDRNLGAVDIDTKANATGLFYQWGRPSPLKAGSFSTSNSRLGSPDAAITENQVFYGRGSTDWLSAPDNTLWGFTDIRSDMKKTIWDPCPVGYMVPDENVWLNFYSRQSARDGNFGTYTIGSIQVKFPITGYYDQNGNIAGNTSVYLWTGRLDASGNAENFQNTQWQTTTTSTAIPRSAAMQVRCVSIPKESMVVKNLSASQTANCYIVSKDGYYKFDATVRGNGVGDLLPLGGTDRWYIRAGQNVMINNVDHVDILWWQGDITEYSTWNGVASPATTQTMRNTAHMNIEILDEGQLTDGFCNFKVSSPDGKFHKGNALLAAYDGNGTILWSWHIWLTDTPVNKVNGNYALMDRNLGATYVPENLTNTFTLTNNQLWASFGFLYQWGRKDPMMQAPLPGQGQYNGWDSVPYWRRMSDGRWEKRTSIISGVASTAKISDVTKAPDTYFGGSAASNNMWFNRTDSGLANNDQNTALWGYAVQNQQWGRSFTKTMYDPCPPGYRTMLHSAGFKSPVDGDQFGTVALDANDRNRNTYGVVINTSGNTNYAQGTYDRAWYPYAGYRNDNGRTKEVATSVKNDYKDNGDQNNDPIWHARMYTGMPYQSAKTRSVYLYNNNNGTGQVTNFNYSSALSIRCQKD